MKPRKIAVVTVGRSDYGILRPILRRIAAEPALELQLIVSGAHFSDKFGRTVGEIERDDFPIAARLPLDEGSGAPEEIARLMGAATTGFAETYARLRPDFVLLPGDRFETHSAAVAAVPLRLPIAHLHGGELSFGAMDDAFRHSITKLAHLHFVSTEEAGRRVAQMGEEPWRITVSGAPGLDNLADVELASMADFAARRGVPLTEPPLLITFHPVTLEHERTDAQIHELLAALERFAQPILWTLPNADPGHEPIIAAIRGFAERRGNVFVLPSLGTRDYFSAMAWAAAMVGNSSSGIVESGSFPLPVVNLGNRQAGRTRGPNVVDCPTEREAITAAIQRALDPAFRTSLASLRNPYGDGHAAPRIVSRLAKVALDERLLVKRFVDLPLRA
jgi:UDP-hydrolysing UDP-N-acetyl-D-glucosamine 2-epimerase